MSKASSSPLPKQTEAPKEKVTYIDLTTAFEYAIEGKKFTKKEWNDENIYGFIGNTFLKIHRDGKDFDWILCEADITGTDYYII